MRTILRLLGASTLFFAASCTLLYNNDNDGLKTPTHDELERLQSVFMSSYYAERGGAPAGARALTPFRQTVSTARATVPVSSLTNVAFASLAPLSFADYPEPGQTTTFTAALAGGGAPSNVYRITATTTYPSSDIRASYVEQYLVRDGGLDSGSLFSLDHPDGNWTTDDPIVDPTDLYAQNQIYREKQELTFDDGTIRTETIISASTADGPKFDPAAFAIDGSLDLSQAFVPAATTDASVLYSSVVLYYVTPETNPDFWFWSGSDAQTILGVRYYTEVADSLADTYTAYTVSFEKTVSTLTTAGGDFAGTVEGIYAGSEHDALTESVLRQRVVYGLAGTGVSTWAPEGSGAITTNMRTRVVNIAGRRDFFLEQLDSDAVSLSIGDSTVYTPEGDAEEILAEDSANIVFARDQQVTPDEGTLPYAVENVDTVGLGALATLYASIETGTSTVGVETAPESNLLPSGTVAGFDGQQSVGTVLDGATAAVTAQMGAKGTVEAWVYINKKTNTPGIVHKGEEVDFSDECFSLQGWNSNGQIAIILNKESGGYDIVKSTINLNTKKWYHLVATWDTSAGQRYIRLYINGALNNSSTSSASAYRQNTSAVLIGSQLPEIYSAAYGYFGLDGKITGANVSDVPLTTADVLAKYNASKDNTGAW